MEKRVFLVDDMIGTQSLVADLLEVLGGFALVGTATSEGEAKLWLDENPNGWDLAVIDLILEAGSGMGVIPRCKELNSAAKVIVFSGYATPALRQHCTKLGADAVFPKDQPADFVGWLRANSGLAPVPS